MENKELNNFFKSLENCDKDFLIDLIKAILIQEKTAIDFLFEKEMREKKLELLERQSKALEKLVKIANESLEE